MSINKEELIRNYSHAIRAGNAAVFGGAGLSRPSGFVDWKELIRPLANSIGLDVNKEHDLLSIAQFYRNKRHTRGSINQVIIDAFSKSANENENINILARLPITTYWTTNYDEVLEQGIKNANRNPDVKIESNQLSNMKRDRDAIVYKMHGDVNYPAHAVLTKEDYELYEHQRPLFRTALKGDLVSKVFLFIGFSFEDPNLDYILSQIHSLLGENVHDHYCFFRRVQRSDYSNDEDFGYERAKQDLQVENLQNYGIQTVYVDDYREITCILMEIEKAFKMKHVFISGSAFEYKSPFDRKKACEFAEKLSGALVHNDYKITSGFGHDIGSAIINGAINVIYSEKYRHIDRHLCLRPFPQIISDTEDRARIFTGYRESMISETGVSIFMFGNKHNDLTGEIVESNGCIEEFEISKDKHNIIIPIGITGYAARTIFEKIKNDMNGFEYLMPYMETLGKEDNIDILIKTILELVQSQAI